VLVDFVLAYWWLLLIEGLAVAAVVGLLSLAAPKLAGSEPRSLASLRAGMAATLIATLATYIGLMVGIAKYLGAGGEYVVYGAALVSALLIGFQWLISPHIISVFYRTREPSTPREMRLVAYVERIAAKSGIRTPKLVIADVSMPNAFAYGSPLAGNYVAVTRGLLRVLNDDEVEAVIGHEVGHLKHRDVAWILALSIIPLAVYFVGRALFYSGLFHSGERRESGGGIALLALGAALIAASVLFRFLITHFNRLREYYADAHSALVTGKPRSLQRALAKIYYVLHTDRYAELEAQKLSLAQPLFIVAPLLEIHGGMFVEADVLVERLKRQDENPLYELLSTHPPISKRLRFLDKFVAGLAR